MWRGIHSTLPFPYAHHRGTASAEAAALMADEEHMISPVAGGLPMQLLERIGSWSGNVTSCLDGAPCTP